MLRRAHERKGTSEGVAIKAKRGCGGNCQRGDGPFGSWKRWGGRGREVRHSVKEPATTATSETKRKKGTGKGGLSLKMGIQGDRLCPERYHQRIEGSGKRPGVGWTQKEFR